MRPATHPYRLTPARQLAVTDDEGHVADLVRLVLLTGPGQRLHRPGFGAGLGTAGVFEPVDRGLAGALELRARASLEEAVGDRIEVVGVAVTTGDSTVAATVSYRLRPAGDVASVRVAVGT